MQEHHVATRARHKIIERQDTTKLQSSKVIRGLLLLKAPLGKLQSANKTEAVRS